MSDVNAGVGNSAGEPLRRGNGGKNLHLRSEIPIRNVPRSSEDASLLRKIRVLVWTFILGLVISGVTAIPLVEEVDLIARMFDSTAANPSFMATWLFRVRDSLHATAFQYPFLFYGTDWLAFGHIMIALVFVGALRDPVRNRWLFDFGLLACLLVIPWAFCFGAVRGIPVFWRLIDCSFGVFGIIPVWLARKWTLELEKRIGK